MGPGEVRAFTRAGQRARLHTSAAGKVFLAHLAPAELDAYLAGPLPAATRRHDHGPGRPSPPSSTRRDVGAGPSTEANSSRRPAPWPCRSSTRPGTCVAALGLNIPLSRLTDDRVRVLIEDLHGAARRLTPAFGSGLAGRRSPRLGGSAVNVIGAARRRDRLESPHGLHPARPRRDHRRRTDGAVPPATDAAARGHARRRGLRAVGGGLRRRRRRRSPRAASPCRRTSPTGQRFIERFAGELDAVLIITPHAFHLAQATAALEAGLDVLLEKPMVMTAAEAEAAHRHARPDGPARRRRLPGQPLAADPRGGADDRGRRGRPDPQHRRRRLAGLAGVAPPARGVRSRRCPVAGSCSTPGAHMLNTVADLAGEDVTQVAAWLEDDGSPVDIRAVVMARLASGALVTMNGVRQGDPVARLRHPGVLRRGDPADRDLGRAPRTAASRRGVRCPPSSRSPRGRSGSSSSPSAPAARRTRARPRSASAWRACGTPSASRPSAAARSSARSGSGPRRRPPRIAS